MATELQQDEPWFQLKIEGTAEYGVDARKLAQMLVSISSAFHAIARSKLGTDLARPGPPSAKEDALAAVRVTHVRPGSLVINAEPPVQQLQGQLPQFEGPTSDDVAYSLYTELERIQGSGNSPAPARVQRAVKQLLRQAAEIGSSAEIVYHPIHALPERPDVKVFRTRIDALNIEATEPAGSTSRRRRLSGHAYMVDIEPGRPRVRIKLPDGRDLTLDVSEDLVGKMPSVLDCSVDVEAEEVLEDDALIKRTLVDIHLLPSAGQGSDKPPKSVAELALEQNLPEGRPDYEALASAIWESEDEVTEFQEYVQQIRRSA